MTCSSRFFHSKSLLRELFPALHRGGDGPSQSPSADVAPEFEQFAPESELQNGAEDAQDIAGDPKSKPRNAVPLP